MNKKIDPSCVVFLLFASIVPNIALAAGLVPCGGAGEAQCDLCFFILMVKQALDFVLFTILPAIAILIFVVGGFNYMANQGNPKSISKTKHVFLTTVLGLVIAFGGWAVINTLFTAMGFTQWQGKDGWWKFEMKCIQYVKEGDDEGFLDVCPSFGDD